MTFLYTFQDKTGKRNDGSIEAVSKAEAYSSLRKQGIRPMSVYPKEGEIEKAFRRKIFLVSASATVLLSLFVAGLFGAMRYGKGIGMAERAVVDDRIALARPRHQIAELPALLTRLPQIFRHPSERVLVRYAQPGEAATGELAMTQALADDLQSALADPILFGDDDDPSVRELKMVVSGLKDEVKAMLAAGGTPEDVFDSFEGRQEMEVSYRAEMLARVRQLGSGAESEKKLKAINANLRAVGMMEIGRKEVVDHFFPKRP